MVSQWSGQTKWTDIVAKIEWNDKNQQYQQWSTCLNEEIQSKNWPSDKETRKTFAWKRY